MKYRRHDLHGLMIFDKPQGYTSMGVVKKVRHIAGFCKTGHAGTLDPMATGVLLLCFGKATKHVPLLMGMTKTYQTTVNLSAFSNTDDADGILTQVQIPAPPSLDAIKNTLNNLTGHIEQTPPPYSAIKVNGQRAYKLARSGEDVKLKSRIIRVDEICINAYQYPNLQLTITCGKGTYIRSLARQIGEALNTGGYLTSLRRTAIGQYNIEDAYTFENLPDVINTEHLLQPHSQ